MGLFLCDMCNEHLSFNNKHVCDPENIRKYIRKLELDARDWRKESDDIRDSVFMLLKSLPSLEGDQILVDKKWLEQLWKAADCHWCRGQGEIATIDDFHQQWMLTHRILCEAFDVFYGHAQTPLQKLQELKEACDRAKQVMYNNDSKFDVTPEDLIAEIKNV